MIELLLKKIVNKQTSLFCGAGISYNSGVPLVKDIKSKILLTLPFEKSDIDFLMNYPIPFELFMESLIENSSSTALLELFEIGTYNTNHLLIANLVKEGYLKTIITTNFDNFLEEALNKLNVKYTMYFKESDFHKINWDKDEVRLIKIHGSIHDKLNIAITIKKVSSKELVYMRNEVIANLLKNPNTDSIIFLGYSCSDIFDINPTIRNVQEKTKTIFFFQHDDILKDYIILPISNKIEPNPFVAFNGYFIQGNTDNLIKDIWDKTLKSNYTQTIKQDPDWNHIIDNWIEEAKVQKGIEVIFYLAGQLLIASSNHARALNYFLKGYELAESSGNHSLSIDFLFSIGRIHRDMQKLNKGLQESLRYLHLALKKSRKFKFRKKECAILLSLGITYEDKKDHNSAIKYYEDALKIAENPPDSVILSKCLGNLGIVFKNLADATPLNSVSLLKKALDYQEKSLQISIAQGDKRSEGRTLGNIAAILSRQNKILEAIEFSKKALIIAIELSDVYHQGIWKHNIGYDYIDIDNIKAKKYLLAAKKIFTTEGLVSFVKICDETLDRLSKNESEI